MDPLRPHASARGITTSLFAPTSPQKSPLHSHHWSSARTSPRQIKFVEPLALPGAGGSHWCCISEEAMTANFRNELFQFHQLLRDAVAKHRATSTSLQTATQLPFLYNRKLFELVTSDRGDAVLHEFFRQWRSMKADALDEQQLLLWDVLDTLVTHMPVVIPEAESIANAKSVFRYLDTLKSLQNLLASALYKRPNAEPAVIEDDDEEYQQQYAFLRKAKKPNAPAARATRKLPLAMYCQQLEEELDTLRVRLANASVANNSARLHIQDLGLLKDQTVSLLLRFWELPKTERLGFFCQIASQTSEEDAALIMGVFLEQSTTQNLIRVWELLHQSPQLRSLFAKSSGRSANALGNALEDAGTHGDPKDNATQTELAHSDSDTSAAGPHSKQRDRMGQLAHLNGITDVFEVDDRENELNDEIEGNKRRSGRKVRIRERGHTPPNERGHSQQHHSGHQHHHHRHGERNIASPPSVGPQETLERLHQLLLSFVKEESKYKGESSKSSATPAIMDAAWKLLELVDPKNAAKMSLHHAPDGALMAHAATQPLIHRPDAHSDLRPDQQYMIKFDQLQALLTSINSFQPQAMPPDVTTAVFHRMDGMIKAFNEFSANAVSAATGDHVDLNASGSSALELTDAMQLVLSKFGKVVRNFAPLAANANGMDQAAVMKLADALEGQDDYDDSSATRRSSMQGISKRAMITKRLRALTTCDELETLSGMIASACDEFTTFREQQSAICILPLMSASERKKYRRDGMLVDGAGVIDEDGELEDEDGKGDGDADEVSRIVKDAKSRRASIAAAKAMKLQQQQQDVDQDVDSDSVYSSRYAGRDIQSSYKQSARGIKLFNIAILLRVIDQMYRENYESMVSSLQYGSRRMEFSDFVYDWHIRKYGLKALAQQHLLKFIQSLRKYDKKTFQCNLSLGFHEHKFVLSLLDKWSLGTFSGTSKHRVESTPRQFKIRVTFALTTLQEALSERFGVYFRSMDSVTARIKLRAPDDEFIQESDLLEIAVDEWLQLRKRIEQILEAVYVAGDLNGDGNLEYDEFAAVISHLTPTMDEKALQRIFTAAHDHVKPRRISFERFIDVILLEKVLSTTPLKSKASDKTITSSNSSGNGTRSSAEGAFSRASMEDEENYQFNLLQETWEHDRDSVAAVLRGITHQQTAASLTFRVAFLTQILSKRVDSKTAWMCHRQIMREISRYQNLNEDQIVVLKSKEETFKKAVLAIRRMQRLGVVLSSMKNDSSMIESQDPEGDNEEDDDAQQLQTRSLTHENDANRYTSVVEQTLAQPPHDGAATMNDMIALEEQLREQFLLNADADGIEDFKSALQQIRRASLHNFSLGLTHEQLEILSRPMVERIGEDEDDDDEEEEEDA